MPNSLQRRRDPGFRAWLIVAAGAGAMLVTALTYPLVPKMATVGRFDNGDGRFSIWNVAWVAHALVSDPAQLLNANIFHPHTGTLAYSELNLVAGVLGLPVYALTGNPVAAHNSAAAMALWLSFLCMWGLVRRLTGSPLAGLVAGAAYTFCPYLLSHTSHIQLLMAFVIPLMFLALHRLVDVPTWQRGVQLGLSVAVAGLAAVRTTMLGGVGVAGLQAAASRARLITNPNRTAAGRLRVGIASSTFPIGADQQISTTRPTAALLIAPLRARAPAGCGPHATR